MNMSVEPMTVPLPPPPVPGAVEPFVTGGELTLLALGAFLTIAVAVTAITFFVRQQRLERHRD
jgi:hypothetical protein